MTPKEQAQELFQKYYNNYGYYGIHVDAIKNSKQCALIAVDEILYSHYTILNGVKPTTHIYWQEVKNEIEKL